MKFINFVLISIFLILSANSFSQKVIFEKYKINWLNKKYIHDNPTPFENAIYIEKFENVPVFFDKISLNEDYKVTSVELKVSKFAKLSGDQLSNLKDFSESLTENFQIHYNTGRSRSKYSLDIFVNPFRKNSVDNCVEKILSFELIISLEDDAKISASTVLYPQNSVLSSGRWYKIRLDKTGVYKISYNDMEEMGVDVGNIDPRDIRIFGNGGGMLPESNDEFCYTDIRENAIYVAGEQDGSFDESDYVLFYGQEQTQWKYNQLSGRFEHEFNVYDDYTYYFITTELGNGKRIGVQESVDNQVDTVLRSFDDFYYHEVDQVNLLGTGRKWYEKAYEFSNVFETNLNIQGLLPQKAVKIDVSLAARSTVNSYLNISYNSNSIGQLMIPLIYETSDTYARQRKFSGSFTPSSSSFTVEMEYIKTSAGANAWLDYLRLNYERNLQFFPPQMDFRSTASVKNGNISEFVISDLPAGAKVWNVTDPLNINEIEGNLTGNNFSFKIETDTLLEFISFDFSSFYKPDFVDIIPNQDLHSISGSELIIITHELFLDQAERLAEHHRDFDDMMVSVVKVSEVYNEFSSGAQDIGAIRNFLRLLYQKSDGSLKPKYVLLFGDASYDFKDRLDQNTNFVPTWESPESLNMINSYVTDDFYVLLDEGEGSNASGSLDMGIGRLPVFTKDQARQAVDKIIHYARYSEEVMKPWRTRICFVADDEDNNTHISQADQLARYVENNLKAFNVDKIYFDSYPQVSTPSGQRYPEVTENINKQVEKGALVINYTGHGGELGWAHEQVLDNNDIQSWNNYDNLPVFITATCEFSRFDDPKRTSAGEYVFLNPEGGAIALFTTSRATFAGANLELNKRFYQFAFEKDSLGEYRRMGDILMMSKNDMGGTVGVNTKKYVLLGDPALRLAYPKDSVVTVKINDIHISEHPDTLRALSSVDISGQVFDCKGNFLNNYNGILYSTVYDKESTITTYGQDDESYPFNFKMRKNIVYNGKAEVLNGEFSFTFIVPKDIAYNFGFGRISYYAASENGDAAGFLENIIVGGYNDKADQDVSGPEIELFINDTNFVNGGVTNADPMLLAYVSDENGINTVGNGIGHDIIALLNNRTDAPIILNDYYESELDNYQKGTIEYPLFDLPEGEYKIYMKVWDVYNNSSDAEIDFQVIHKNNFALEKLINYPNPFVDQTNFVFEHNQPGEEIDVILQVFSLSGKLEAQIEQSIVTSGYKSEPIKWNGKNTYGGDLQKGLYIYTLKASTKSGLFARENGKLIILPDSKH